jgi:DNA-binding Lrp family transcriptional regulator
LSRLAKRIRIGKDALTNRLRSLEERGYIKGYTTMINPNKFGLTDCKFMVKLRDTTPEIENRIADFIKKTREVPWAVRVEDRWDFEVWYLADSVNDASSFWQRFKKRFGRYVESMRFGVWMNVRYFGRAYLVEGRLAEISDLVATGPQKTKISGTDLKILRLLGSNARMPVFEIAERCGVSSKTASKRIKRLEEKGVIVGYRLIFGLEKLGVKYYNIHINFQNMDEEKDKEFDEFIRTDPNVVYDNVVLGGSDIELSVQTSSDEELRRLNEAIKRRFSGHIRDYFTVEFTEEIKFGFISGISREK